MTALTITKENSLIALKEEIYDGLLASKHKLTTKNTYRLSLKHFAHYLVTGEMNKGENINIPESEVKQILQQYINLSKRQATAHLTNYKKTMMETQYTPNAINIKIAAVKAFIRYAFEYEQCSYIIEQVKSLPSQVYRDTTGTTPENIKQMLAQPDLETVKGKRDYAILRLLWDCALRRGEINQLNIGDFNYSELTLKIQGKGEFVKEAIHLPQTTADAIQHWLDIRQPLRPQDPLFISIDRATKGHRLSTKSICNLTVKYSTDVPNGKVLSPHKVRHSSITAVLDASNGNIRLAQKLSRHKNLDVLSQYDDNRVSLQKEAVNILADLVDN